MTVVWHRGDLRVHDHPALAAAESPVGLVVLDKNILTKTTPRRRAWFCENVRALRVEYKARGGVLAVRIGVPWEEVPKFAGSNRVHALCSYTPYGLHRDREVAKRCGIEWFPGCYVHEPGSVLTAGGKAYSVFTPFRRRWAELSCPAPVAPAKKFSFCKLELGEVPRIRSDVELPQPGEKAALRHLQTFLQTSLAQYQENRDWLDGSGSSRLSYYISIGALSARVVVSEALKHGEAGQKFVSELAWRDFMADLLLRFPQMLIEPFEAKWKGLPWNEDKELFEAWKAGKTGVPPVDAAMRQLKSTGWISNRARMIAAQFLSKHLMLPWQWGEKVFRDWLLDGELSQNVGNWQWCAGLGVDAAPYFRVFNPVMQAKQHDPNGDWLSEWVPESGGSPEPLPNAIVDLGKARARYLEMVKGLS